MKLKFAITKGKAAMGKGNGDICKVILPLWPYVQIYVWQEGAFYNMFVSPFPNTIAKQWRSILTQCAFLFKTAP